MYPQVKKTANAEGERMCAGCRETAPASALLRFALMEEGAERTLIPDLRRRLPGRGVNVHPRPRCVRQAVRSGFARSLRRPVDVNYASLLEMARGQLQRRIEGLVASAQRKKALLVGASAIAAFPHVLPLVWTASDASEQSVNKALEGKALVRRFVAQTKSDLGRLLSRTEVAMMAVLDDRIAEEVAAAVAMATELSEAQ